MRISDWSSDVCSSDLAERVGHDKGQEEHRQRGDRRPIELHQRRRSPEEQQQEAQRHRESDDADLHGDVQVAVVEIQIGSAHVCTPFTNAHLLCLLLLLIILFFLLFFFFLSSFSFFFFPFFFFFLFFFFFFF